MEELNDNQIPDPEIEEEDEDYELSHTDKLVGVFTEPGATFEKMAKSEPKVSDWLIPVIILIIVSSLSSFIMMSNPSIKHQIMTKQMAQMEEQFDKMVDAGQLTQEQADQQLEQTREMMSGSGGVQMILQSVGVVFFIFIFFFVVSLAFFIGSKFILKGEGTYTTTMSAYGLPYYIAVIQVIVMIIIAFTMDKFMTGVSVGAFMDADKNTLAGFFLHKLDLFSIWFYAVASIGLAKMFKSESTGKYFGLVFGMWIGFGLLFYFIAQAVPFLGFLNQ